MENFEIRPLDPVDHPAVRAVLTARWGSSNIVTRGKVHRADRLPGFAAEIDGEIAGLITFRIEKSECEIVSLDSLKEKIGIGKELVEAVKSAAEKAGCRRLWLVTTNDNAPAIEFYKKRGFKIAAIHKGAIAISRKLKSEIPLVGINGIPLTDEIEMELWLR